ncbi:MAG: hypothetical protein Q8L81_00125 [Bacteroidota bacterium]|nr:hypothetical protein [Bacteroidota bacterium]
MILNEVYHYFDTSCEPKIIGVRNGIYQAEFNESCFVPKAKYDEYYDAAIKKNAKQKANIKKFIKGIRRLDLLKSAKLTDFLQPCPHIPSVNFLVSESLKAIFEEHKLGNSFLQPTVVRSLKTGEKHHYSFFYHNSIKFDDIIFESSEIYQRTVFAKNGKLQTRDKLYPIRNRAHYDELSEKFFLPPFSKICVDSKYKQFDYIEVYTYKFVSQRLKEKLIAGGMTGIEFGTRVQLVFD